MWPKRKKADKPKTHDDPFAKIQAFIPAGREAALKIKAVELGLPVSRLIGIALDNEFESDEPFDFPAELPKNYQEFMYAKEGGILLNFMVRYKHGIGREMLLLLRHDLGIPSKERLLGAIAELLDKNMIYEKFPSKPAFSHHKPDYKYLYLSDATVRQWHTPRKVDDT